MSPRTRALPQGEEKNVEDKGAVAPLDSADAAGAAIAEGSAAKACVFLLPPSLACVFLLPPSLACLRLCRSCELCALCHLAPSFGGMLERLSRYAVVVEGAFDAPLTQTPTNTLPLFV